MNFIKNTLVLLIAIIKFILMYLSAIVLFRFLCYGLNLGGIISGIIVLVYIGCIILYYKRRLY